MTPPTTLLRRTTNLALVAFMAATVYVANSTHDAPEGDYQDMGPAQGLIFAQERGQHPKNEPTWAWVAADFPACSPETGVLVDEVVIVDSSADAHRISFDRAWALNHDDERANDVWVVGTC